MAWQPGQTGNPNGAKKERMFYAALTRAIAQDDGKQVRAAADKLLKLAADGEAWAIKELADRLDGKPAQMIEGNSENPLFMVGLPWLKQQIQERNSE